MNSSSQDSGESASAYDADLQSDWTARQKALGNVPQAVLLRNLPTGINGLLDSWHRLLLRWALTPLAPQSSDWIADLGCGYGRMADEAEAIGFTNIIGLDYESGFCRQYQLDHGYAIRGSIASPPFAAGSLSAAYAITSLMYIGPDRASGGLQQLDISMKPGARIFLLEAGAEFNNLSRTILRRKRTQSLAVQGFSCEELGDTMLPGNWRRVASGGNIATTLLLPLLLIFYRWPRIFDRLAATAMRIDRPRPGLRDCGWRRFCLHRWVLCEKKAGPTPTN